MIYRVITAIGFAGVIFILFALEYLGRRKNSTIPTFGEFLGFAMRPRAGRLFILLAWLWLGWHFFSR
jgi:hypothetical protein